MSENLAVQLLPAAGLPGSLRKRLTVPPDHLALLVEGEKIVGQRGPGEHTLGNWPRPAPDVVLLSRRPFDLHLRIQYLRSGDKQRFDLVWPLTVQVQDPARFYTARLAPAPDAETALTDLADDLAGRLWDRAQEETVHYTLADLQAADQVRAAVGKALRPDLTAALAEAGLTLVGHRLPQPLTLEDEQAALEAMNQALRAARDARFEALFERLEDKEMLAHRLTEWAAERGQEPPPPEMVDLLWQAVDQAPEEAAVRAQQAAQALEQEVASLRITLQSERTQSERRFRQLMARLEKAEKAKAKTLPEAPDPVRTLKWLLFILRMVGATLTLVAALTALLVPQMSDEYTRLHSAALVITIATGLLTLLSDLWVQHRLRQAQAQAAEEKRQASRATLQRRLTADRLVRARLEAGLKQVADNLEAAWKEGYRLGGEARDLAVELREAARQAQRLGEQEVRAANYRAGRYLSQERAPDEQLNAVLDLDNDLLLQSQSLAGAAEKLYEQVGEGQIEQARATLRRLRTGLNALRNRFTERGAYLMNPT